MSDVTFTAEERAYLDTGDTTKLTTQDAPEATTKTPAEPDIDFGDDAAKEAAKEKEPEKSEDDKLVSINALRNERKANADLKRQLEAQQRQWQIAEQRMAEIQQAIQPREPIPDPVQDPIAALQYTQKQLQDMQSRSQQEAAQRQHQEQQQTVIRQVEDAYRTSWMTKLNENPQHAEAYQAFVRTMDVHMKIRGVTDPAERAELVKQEERAIAYRALQNGEDPAEAIIANAEAYGYRPAPAAPQADPVQQLADKQKGLDASRSLTNARGGGSDNSLTPQRIAEMSADDFAALKAKLSPSKFNKLMGAA